MIVIAGGGISGLSAAWHLARLGHACTLIEKNRRLGGVIETVRWEGCTLEGGPDSFLAAKPEAVQLARELGLESEIISSNDHLRVTSIWKDDQLTPVPEGLAMMIPTRLRPIIATPLVGWRTKLRMGLEFFRRPTGPQPDRSAAEFIESHFGAETVDYLAEPLLAGVYGGDVNCLSADSVLGRFVQMERAYGSLTRGMLRARKQESGQPLFQTLRDGLASLVESLESRLGAQMRVIRGAVEVISRGESGWRLRVGGNWLEASRLIIAAPAYEAASLIRAIDGELARLLETIEYSSSITATLVYRPGRIGRELAGFGFLVPRKTRRKILACTFVHNKFPHRAPPGYAVLRCFLGGAGNERVLEYSDNAVQATVFDELRRILRLEAAPDHCRISRWPRSMAQYTLGHVWRVARIRERLQLLPDLWLAGNAYSGIGIPDCIRGGREAAERVAAGSGFSLKP